jgi:hypothetical protein
MMTVMDARPKLRTRAHVGFKEIERVAREILAARNEPMLFRDLYAAIAERIGGASYGVTAAALHVGRGFRSLGKNVGWTLAEPPKAQEHHQVPAPFSWPPVMPLALPAPTPAPLALENHPMPAMKVGKADLGTQWGWDISYLRWNLAKGGKHSMRLGGAWVIGKRNGKHSFDCECDCGTFYTPEHRDVIRVDETVCCVDCGVILTSSKHDVILMVAQRQNKEREASSRAILRKWS